MKTQLLMLILALGILRVTSAQTTFQKTYGDVSLEQAFTGGQTVDGGFYLAGVTWELQDDYDLYLIKTDSDGNMQWGKKYGGDSTDYLYSCRQTYDGGYLMAGVTQSFGAVKYDCYVIKTDADGDVLWSKTYGGFEDDLVNSFRQTPDSGYILAGYTRSFGAGSMDGFLIKINASGIILWSKTLGESSYDGILTIEATADGGYILGGQSSSFGAGSYDCLVTKTDSLGNPEWSNVYGEYNSEFVQSINQTSDGGFIIGGATGSFGGGGYDSYLIKTDSTGNLLWSKAYGNPDSENITSVHLTTDNGYIFSERTYSFTAGTWNGTVIKTDTWGDTLWTRTHGGNDYNQSWYADQTNDGFIIAGFTQSFGAGYSDFYLIRTDSSGTSGCNDISVSTLISSPLTIVSTASLIVSTPSFSVTSPLTIMTPRGVETTLCSSVGINEIEKGNSFLISPNPNIGHFMLSFEKIIPKGNILIFNIIGDIIFSEDIFNETKKEINLMNVSGGIYLIKLFDGEKYYYNKILIEN